MATHDETYTRSPSTTSAWRYGKIRRPAGGQGDSGPKGHRWRRLPPRNAREPLTIKVKYRGGPEAWVEIHARGDVGRYPGHAYLVDVLSDLCGGLPGR